ncbi:MAG: CBS domain-containing protein [Spirochaetia bacterium]
MTVEALLERQSGDLFSVSEDKKMCECVGEMNNKRVGALVVLNKEGKLSGIISERDVLKLVHEKAGEMCSIPVKEVMTPRDKMIIAEKEENIADLMDKMMKNSIRHIPILAGEQLIGVISIRDVVKMLLDNALTENKQLKDYVYLSY